MIPRRQSFDHLIISQIYHRHHWEWKASFRLQVHKGFQCFMFHTPMNDKKFYFWVLAGTSLEIPVSTCSRRPILGVQHCIGCSSCIAASSEEHSPNDSSMRAGAHFDVSAVKRESDIWWTDRYTVLVLYLERMDASQTYYYTGQPYIRLAPRRALVSRNGNAVFRRSDANVSHPTATFAPRPCEACEADADMASG